jgi:DNA-binding NtrC family response regulator
MLRPGNVRGFENVLERAVVLSGGEAIHPEDLALSAPGSSAQGAVSRYQTRLEVEQEVMLQALQEHGGQAGHCEALGLALSTLYAS